MDSEIDICAETSEITQTEPIITSPGYPNTSYPDNSDCIRVVRFQNITLIRIEFLDDFQLQNEIPYLCNNDFIEIRNGEDK